jgi:hypothetical protein
MIENFKKSAAAFNANPSSLDAQNQLSEACGDRRVIKAKPDNSIDIDESAKLLAFALRTKTPGLSTALTVADLIAKSEPAIEADPITRRPLLDGMTTEHPIIDWSGVSMDRREVAAYAIDQVEIHFSDSETVAHLLSKKTPPSTPPWPRLIKEWSAIKGAEKRTHEQEDIYRRVMDRLYFQTPESGGKASDRLPSVDVGLSAAASEIRKAIERKCRTDSDFDAFVSDHFLRTYKRFSDGMDRMRKVNLLLQCEDHADIIAALRN